MTTTARKMITRALRKAKILARGEPLSSGAANDGLEELNGMLGEWSNDGLMLFSRGRDVFTLSGGVASYNIGTGSTINTERPMVIVDAFIREAENDYPLSIISEETYNSIPNKASTGLPNSLSYDGNYPIGRISLYPAPSTGYHLHMLSEKQLSQIATLDTELDLPPGWDNAIVYNLAVRQAPDYGQQADPLLIKMSIDAKAKVARTVSRSRSIDWSTPADSGNVFTGYR